jgi:uncharacterized protein involved in exopolysaccharide biosynthesis
MTYAQTVSDGAVVSSAISAKRSGQSESQIASSLLQQGATPAQLQRLRGQYAKKIYNETKERYDKARHKYAYFSDANRRVFLETVRSEQTNLSNELSIQYQVYAQASAQMQQAEADVQRETPAFAILQPATVPVQKAGPARAKMCLIFLFLAFLGTSVWILYKEDDLKQLLGMS